MKLTRALACSVVLAAAAAAPAFAALGGDASSVQSDLLRMKGSLRVTSNSGFALHEISTSYGSVVREYVGPDGKVFAVSWHGPVNPDLHQMFGSYYAQYLQAAGAARTDHRHFAIEEPGLVVQISGRMRAFFGRAWVPGMLPPNFSTADIN